MMDMQGKIAEIVREIRQCCRSSEDAAYAIVAALTDRIAPLVWVEVSRHPHHYISACGKYKVYDSGHDAIAFGYRSDDPGGYTYVYHHDNGPFAFDAANAHNRAAIMAAFNQLKEPK